MHVPAVAQADGEVPNGIAAGPESLHDQLAEAFADQLAIDL
jgi:hypothetical protein